MDPRWQEITDRPEFAGYCFREAPAPETDSESVRHFRTLCAENKCGCYRTNWGCPPDSCTENEVLALLEKYTSAVIFSRRFEYSEFRDLSEIAKIQKDFQNLCRNLSHIASEKGIGSIPLGDGGCTFCEKCSYPAPCRSPANRVISISGMGIDIGNYLKSQDIEFRFEKDAVTLYGIILF